MLVDLRTYFLPSPRSLLSPLSMLLDRQVSQTRKTVSNCFGREGMILQAILLNRLTIFQLRFDSSCKVKEIGR